MATLNLRNPNGYDGQPGTQYKQGIVRLATDAEAAAGTANNVVLTPAQQVIASGSIGNATLASGTVTVANTNITATDSIIIQRIAANASTTLGEFSYTISAGTSFTINSLILGTPGSVQTGDLSTVFYAIVKA